MAGTLDPTPSSVIKRYSKIINIDGMTRPETKAALDEFLNKGWRLAAIYNEGAQTRACLIREQE
ncbi:MAG: hypothetical protein JRJ45_00210 [Deltaproteobacteria bacterium]|nr:hypothetical protein [Deltaproteobacteria bacterium]